MQSRAPIRGERLRVSVYVDGFNLYRRLLEGQPQDKWLDLEALAEYLLPEFDLIRVRYFTAIIKALPSADPSSPQRQQAYLRALRSRPRTTVHLGNFRIDKRRMPLHPIELNADGSPRLVTVRKTEEKGSDVALASYLLLDAVRGESDCFVVLSNDSDLVTPMKLAHDELGKKIGLLSPMQPKRASNELKQTGISVHRQVDVRSLALCQLPDVIDDEHGTVRRPAKWARNSEGSAEAEPSNQEPKHLGVYH